MAPSNHRDHLWFRHGSARRTGRATITACSPTQVPSSWCGLSGLKTTIGRVSTYGILPLADRDLLAERIGILAGDAKQVAFEINGEAAAERLSDEAGLALAQGDRDAGGNHDGFHVAPYGYRFVVVAVHGDYSVETGSAARSSAAFNVCQQRLAHFTRAGNSRTPDSAASLPSLAGSTAASC